VLVIWLFCKALDVCWLVGLCKCAKLALQKFSKMRSEAIPFFFIIIRPCPVTLSVYSSQTSRKAILSPDKSVVTRHCQRLQSHFFSMCPNVRRYVQLAWSRGGACFCTRGAMQGYAVITLFSRWQKP